MKLKILIAVLALQTAWILGTVVTQENILRVGKVVLLETQPVDPRDPLRGDFVRLNYKISNVPLKLLAASVKMDQPYVGNVFVAIAPTGTNGFWEITRADIKNISPADNEVVLRGAAGRSWWNPVGTIRVEYGIEQYFVAEGTGNPRGKLTVQAAVSSSGRATIKEVFVDGKPYVEVMKEQGK